MATCFSAELLSGLFLRIDLQNAKLSTKVCLSIREFSIKVADMKVSLEKAEVSNTNLNVATRGMGVPCPFGN